mmetsp:Transcript_6716/g.8833  ORF Transcript_6716/g.8833 Transcript_6716/m.8833 type:complete len:444 (+) Transcript_6716:3-1334(+)
MMQIISRRRRTMRSSSASNRNTSLTSTASTVLVLLGYFLNNEVSGFNSNAFPAQNVQMKLFSQETSRQDFLKCSSLAAIASSILPEKGSAKTMEAPPASPRPLLWTIDEEMPPNMQGFTAKGEKRIIKQIAQTSDVVFLGEHHNSAQDHQMQADLIGRFAKERKKMAIGLEMIQQQFQPVLDAYISKQIPDLKAADDALFKDTEWEDRWFWSFENYLPVFHLAREKAIPLIALNVAGETMSKVRRKGLDGLDSEERRQYVSDPTGFISAVRDPGFKAYSDRVILSSFEDHVEMGIYPPTSEAQRNFFAGRILWDEAMADKASKFVRENPDTLMTVLIGSDHVKFGYGSAWRCDRLLNKQTIIEPAAAAGQASGAATGNDKKYKVTTMMLNPTAEDSLSASRTLRLKLGLDGERFDNSKPLADYLMFSSYPKVSLLSHPLNPIS